MSQLRRARARVQAMRASARLDQLPLWSKLTAAVVAAVLSVAALAALTGSFEQHSSQRRQAAPPTAQGQQRALDAVVPAPPQRTGVTTTPSRAGTTATSRPRPTAQPSRRAGTPAAAAAPTAQAPPPATRPASRPAPAAGAATGPPTRRATPQRIPSMVSVQTDWTFEDPETVEQGVWEYEIVSACEDCGLAVLSDPTPYAVVVDVLEDGDDVDLVCQLHGDPATDGYAVSDVWYFVQGTGWISALYVDIPGPLPRC